MTKLVCWVSRPGPTETGWYINKRWLEAYNSGSRKKRDSFINVEKTKALISCAVTTTTQQVCTIVFAYMQKASLLMTWLKISCRIILDNDAILIKLCSVLVMHDKSKETET